MLFCLIVSSKILSTSSILELVSMVKTQENKKTCNFCVIVCLSLFLQDKSNTRVFSRLRSCFYQTQIMFSFFLLFEGFKSHTIASSCITYLVRYSILLLCILKTLKMFDLHPIYASNMNSCLIKTHIYSCSLNN